jgi:hypothetical protein
MALVADANRVLVNSAAALKKNAAKLIKKRYDLAEN